MANFLRDMRDAIAVKVKDTQGSLQRGYARDIGYSVLAKQQHRQALQPLQVGYFLDLIVVQIQKNKVG